MNPPKWNDLPAHNKSPRRLPIQCIVLHDTDGSGKHGDTLYLASKQSDGRSVSVDFTVEKDGSIWKLNPDLPKYAMWHAGAHTKWKHLLNGDVNHGSVGIEICQASSGVVYTAEQMGALLELVAWLCWAFKLPVAAITTHAVISCAGKTDPRKFDLAKFAANVQARLAGSTPVPAPSAPVVGYRPPVALQTRLAGIVELAAKAREIDLPLKTLKHLCVLPGGALFIESGLQLCTDGPRVPGVAYEPSHQDETAFGALNANTVPYIVLPDGGFAAHYGIRRYDVATVLHKDRIEHAVYGEVGPTDKIGEGSIALHRSLGYERIKNRMIVDSGIDSDVVMLVYPGSGNGTPQTPEKIRTIGRVLFHALGGVIV